MSEERMGETKERLEQIFRDYYQLIYRVAFSQVKNHADAEDITQEVFLKIIRHDMRYQSMEHERAWIVRVTINLCRDLLKSKWHKTSVSMEEVSEAQRGSCENFTEIQDDMMWAVLQLPEKYRNCLYLFYYEDYSIKEIAQSLEMPENTVKTNLKRGRQALKEFLEKKTGFDRNFRTEVQMEVSRIGSRFYENAAQSGKKVKGKQQDGFAYELQKSYDEKYRSEDTDETGMTAADGAQASGIAEFGSMGGLRAKEVVAEGVLSKAVSACEVKNLTAEDADYVEKHLAEGYVLKAKQSDDGKEVYVEQKFDDGTVKAYSVDLDKIDEETGNLIEQAAKACVQKNGKEQQTDKDWHEALEEFAAYVKNRIKNGPPKFATGATQMSVEEWDKLVKNLDDTIDDVKKEQEQELKKRLEKEEQKELDNEQKEHEEDIKKWELESI